ncbi:hypothetical protein [Vibrio sonorensis]|uniref:hypothetical protein n=1 Tax=Vibrio sonorensis TaxID=1004316 RepID=UPI0008D9D860|nr:hypothetical protein [Vibrio sonorensis]
MLWETLERVNQLRQKALANPEFIQSAQAHEKALKEGSANPDRPERSKKPRKPKSLADIYHHVEFGSNPAGSRH